MDFRHIGKALLAALLVVSVLSCKKDTDETKLYLDNYPYFDAETFVLLGQSVTYTPDKVTADNGNEDIKIGYSWTVSGLMESSDTVSTEDGHFDYTFSKDTLGTFTVSCSAFAKNSDGYYSTTATASVTTVKPGLFGGSITGLDEELNDTYIVDDRADQPEGELKYYYTTIGGSDWMIENLAYTTKAQKYGMAYLNSDAAEHVFGRYYSWEEAQTVCPAGWHLSTEAEWMALASKYAEGLEIDKDWVGPSPAFLVYAKFNGEDLWEWWPEVDAKNASGLSVIPSGWCYFPDKAFKGLTNTAAFWTSSESGEKGVYRYMFDDKTIVYRGLGDKKSFGASVRCVR